MNIVTISLIISCNYSCSYCPARKWLRPVDFGGNKLNNKALFGWIDKYLSPDNYIIELTGGEPGLYSEINELIAGLSSRGYRGMCKTNGTFPIIKDKNFPLITAWHTGVPDMPDLYDWILIIKNPEDNWEDKVNYCEKNNIPYKTVLFDGVGLKKRSPTPRICCKLNKIISLVHINSSGQLTKCSASPVTDENINIFNMSPPPLYADMLQECPRCKNVNDVVLWLPQDMLDKIDQDYLKYKKHEVA